MNAADGAEIKKGKAANALLSAPQHGAMRAEIAFIKVDIAGAWLKAVDHEDLFTNLCALLAKAYRRKLKHLREAVGAKYLVGKVDLGWS